jgi:hypothetical protein
MKKNVILFIAINLFAINLLVAQSLSESLGSTKTNFQIVSDSTDLMVSDQIILLRAEKKTYSDNYSGWGYGYREFHLEFTSKKSIVERYATSRSEKHQIKLTFYDSKGNLLTNITLPAEFLNQYTNSATDNTLFFYSLDLIDVPIVVLDKTKKLDITKYD